jgi:hypothetical protein
VAPALPPLAPRALGEGRVLRRADDDDLDALVGLNVELFGEHEAAGVTAVLTGAVGAEWLVVATGPGAERPGSRVVSACVRIPHPFVLDGVPVPGSQIEWVTTAEDHRGQGLVRALFRAHHERAAAAGELLQLVAGIPYYYRKLGYGYGIDAPPSIAVSPDAAPAPDGGRVTVRPAGLHDIEWILATERERPRAGLTVARTAAQLECWLARTEPHRGATWEWLLVAEDGDERVGWSRTAAWADESVLFALPGLAPDREVADRLLGRAVQHAAHLADHLGRPVQVLAPDQPGTPWSRAVHAVGRVRPEPSGIYARCPDELALLQALEPALSRRLAASGLARDEGELVLSLYERGIRLAWSDGRITAVEAAPADPDPFDAGGVGVAPDWFPALVLGRWGATGLAERTDDTLLGVHAPVLDVLVPALPNDLAADL